MVTCDAILELFHWTVSSSCAFSTIILSLLSKQTNALRSVHCTLFTELKVKRKID